MQYKKGKSTTLFLLSKANRSFREKICAFASSGLHETTGWYRQRTWLYISLMMHHIKIEILSEIKMGIESFPLMNGLG